MFTVYSENSAGTTLVSNIFIDNYMKYANDAQLKVYLHLLRTLGAGRSTSISDMADRFNHTERDILRSIRYWEDRGLIALEYDDGGNLSSLHMITPRADSISRARADAFGSGQMNPARDQIPLREAASGMNADDSSAAYALPRLGQMAIPSQHAPAAYDSAPAAHAGAPAAFSSESAAQASKPEERDNKGESPAMSSRQTDAASVEAFRSSAKRAQLLFVIEQYIGKPLSPKEIESVCFISEQLHFSDSLIDYLLQYCIDRGKKDFRYIEKVAVSWSENGITTPKQAERAVSNFSRNKRGSGAGVKPSANPFNQFEQNQYDFDQLEKEILGN